MSVAVYSYFLSILLKNFPLMITGSRLSASLVSFFIGVCGIHWKFRFSVFKNWIEPNRQIILKNVNTIAVVRLLVFRRFLHFSCQSKWLFLGLVSEHFGQWLVLTITAVSR